ncbi:hypothetical protein KBD20_02320 [Candidatus Saccharibacteria bacterium]|nr:hypothetical protein [Candidatus Saccharibacteria bacterium]
MANTEVLDHQPTFEAVKERTAEELWATTERVGDAAIFLAYASARVQLPPGMIGESNDVRFAIARAIVETKVDEIEADVDRALDPLPDRIERPLERFLGIDQADKHAA